MYEVPSSKEKPGRIVITPEFMAGTGEAQYIKKTEKNEAS